MYRFILSIVKISFMSALKNSNPIQLTLPLEIINEKPNPEYLEIVKQNWKITFSRQILSSVHVKRVMGLIAAQIKEDGEVKEYYQITADKIISETGLQSKEVYKRMKGVVYELAGVCYFIEDDETGTIIPRHLLDTTRFKYPAGYANGTLTVAFNPQLNGIVNQLAHYSKYELNEYINFGSWYSMRLYEMLAAFKDKDHVEFEIEKYREWMGCGVEWDREGKPKINKKTGKPKYIKYDTHSDAILRTTSEPLKELKGTEMEFRVSPVYAAAAGRGRPPIIKVRFDFVWKTKTLEEKIKGWCEQSPEFADIYTRLKRWKIEDVNIEKYLTDVGFVRANQLMYEWQQKDAVGSKDPIKNRKLYCNKVFAAEGMKRRN